MGNILHKNHNSHTIILRSAVIVGLLTLLSRITGMLQSRLVASCLGAGLAADAFMVAFRIPNLLRRFTAEGTMTSAFMLTLSEVEANQGKAAGRDMVGKFLGTLGLILIIFTIVMMPVMGIFTGLQMLGRIAPGINCFKQLNVLRQVVIGNQLAPVQWTLTTNLARIMFPYLTLVSITAGLSAVLNLRKRFGLPASASTVWNLSFIGFAIASIRWTPTSWQTPERIAIYLAIAAIVGGICQIILILPSFNRLGFGIKWGLYFNDHNVRTALKRMLPGLLGTGIHPINVVISTMLASQLAVGAQTILFNSNMMGEMVLGIFATSLATVSLPTMSKLVVAGDMQGLSNNFVGTLRHIAILVIPGSVGMAVLAWPIVAIIFQTGRYDLVAVNWTATTLSYQAVGLLFIATNRIMMQCLYALKDYKSPVYASLLGMIVNIGLSILLMKPLGTSGIALANGLASLTSLAFLVVILNKQINNLPWHRVMGGWLSMSIAAALMGVFSYFGAWYLDLGSFKGSIGTSLRLFPLIGLSALFYAVLLFLFRVPEIHLIRDTIWRKLRIKFNF